jgi:hypothetical protein
MRECEISGANARFRDARIVAINSQTMNKMAPARSRFQYQYTGSCFNSDHSIEIQVIREKYTAIDSDRDPNFCILTVIVFYWGVMMLFLIPLDGYLS